MFRRVLVANRGEIAARIIRTLNKMGIESVAIFSEADAKAPYLSDASSTVCIGPAAASESYLLQDAVLQAALQSECEAIHPGFGFLSENAVFARRCSEQKLTFIGPSPNHISLMGDKARAKNTMANLGVPVLLGSDGVVKNMDEAKARAYDAGYPVLLKARAGGGGKGMRIVHTPSELNNAYLEASREAQSAFGDGELYVEKFIQGARHIEFQILADNFSNVICLGERECSIQRRNQKLIEEAPANNFSEDLRSKTTAIIVNAVKNIGYTNAGTIEFLLDAKNNLYFMEMNTRIQVEHPVTEMVFGVDIVEWQLRIACNEKLSIKQDDLKLNGVAIECRINAEDPSCDFMPNPGTIAQLTLPKNSIEGPLRIDTHVKENYTVPPFYDSMVAKIIAHGRDRPQAIEIMTEALKNTEIGGIKTTLDFHKSILNNQTFKQGKYDCSFVEKNILKLCTI